MYKNTTIAVISSAVIMLTTKSYANDLIHATSPDAPNAEPNVCVPGTYELTTPNDGYLSSTIAANQSGIKLITSMIDANYNYYRELWSVSWDGKKMLRRKFKDVYLPYSFGATPSNFFVMLGGQRGNANEVLFLNNNGNPEYSIMTNLIPRAIGGRRITWMTYRTPYGLREFDQYFVGEVRGHNITPIIQPLNAANHPLSVFKTAVAPDDSSAVTVVKDSTGTFQAYYSKHGVIGTIIEMEHLVDRNKYLSIETVLFLSNGKYLVIWAMNQGSEKELFLTHISANGIDNNTLFDVPQVLQTNGSMNRQETRWAFLAKANGNINAFAATHDRTSAIPPRRSTEAFVTFTPDGSIQNINKVFSGQETSLTPYATVTGNRQAYIINRIYDSNQYRAVLYIRCK